MTDLSVGVGSGSRAQLLSSSTRTAATTSSIVTDWKQVKWTSDDDVVKDGGEAPSIEDRDTGDLGVNVIMELLGVDVVTGWDTPAAQEYIDWTS